jgi:predicted DNA-binding transcriptional regulator AlpA
MKSRHVAATHLLTVAEVAAYLHVSRATIYRLAGCGVRRDKPAWSCE